MRAASIAALRPLQCALVALAICSQATPTSGGLRLCASPSPLSWWDCVCHASPDRNIEQCALHAQRFFSDRARLVLHLRGGTPNDHAEDSAFEGEEEEQSIDRDNIGSPLDAASVLAEQDDRASLVAAMRGFDVALKSNENWRSRTAGVAAEEKGSRGTDLFAHRSRTRSSMGFDDEGGKDADERGELDLSVPEESSVPSGSGVEHGWGSQDLEPGYELLHDEDDQDDYVGHGRERRQGRGGYRHVSVVVGKSEGGWAKADLGWGLLRQALRTVHKGARKWLGKGEFVGWGGLWGVGYGAGSWCGGGDLPGKAADVTRSVEVAANWQQFVDELPVYRKRFSAIEAVGGRGARNSLGGASANSDLRQRAEEAWCRGGDMKKGQREALNLYRHALRAAGGNDVELLCSYAQEIMMKQSALL